MSHSQEYWDGFADGYECAFGGFTGSSAEETAAPPIPRRSRTELRSMLFHIRSRSAVEVGAVLTEAVRAGDLAAYRDYRRCAELLAGRVA